MSLLVHYHSAVSYTSPCSTLLQRMQSMHLSHGPMSLLCPTVSLSSPQVLPCCKVLSSRHARAIRSLMGLPIGLTALTFITESYDVKKGDYVFVHTVAGGLGLLFAQMAKHRGAIVIGTTSTQEKADIAKEHGADHVILYPVENTADRVLEITKGEGVHVIYDGVGKDTCVVAAVAVESC